MGYSGLMLRPATPTGLGVGARVALRTYASEADDGNNDANDEDENDDDDDDDATFWELSWS